MDHRHRAILHAIFAVNFAAGCWAQAPFLDPMLNRTQDPPDVYTIGRVDDTKMLFRISFFPYDRRVKVYQIPILLQPAAQNSGTVSAAMHPRVTGDFDDNNFPSSLLPSASPHLQPLVRSHDDGGAVTPPDAEEFQSYPWELPEPIADFPLPAQPFPDLFGDPYVSLPDPPAPPRVELDFTDFSDGTLNIIDSGEPLGHVAAPGVAEQKPRATIAKTIGINVGSSPAAIVRSRDFTTAYIAVSGAGQVAVVDMLAKKVKSPINISGSAPYSMAITPDDKTLYVAEAASIGGLFAVDLASGAVKQIPIAVYYATSLVLMPDATRLWICNNNKDDVTVLDLLTNTIVAHLPVVSPWAVAFNRTGTRAYITSAPRAAVNGTVEVYDANSYVKLTSVAAGHTPHGVAVTPSGRHVFVVNKTTPGSVMQISTATNTVIRTFPVGDSPGGLGMER